MLLWYSMVREWWKRGDDHRNHEDETWRRAGPSPQGALEVQIVLDNSKINLSAQRPVAIRPDVRRAEVDNPANNPMTILYKDPIVTFGKDYVLPLSWIRLFFHWHGSLVQRLLFEIVVWMAAASVVIATKIYVGNWPLSLMRMFAALVKLLSPVLTFMLGFYTSTIYSRWWMTRVTMAGEHQIAAYNVALEMTQFIYDDNDPVTAARLKQLIVRWMNLAFGVLCSAVVTEGDHLYRSLDKMEEIGLCTKEERYRLEHDIDRSVYTVPVMWAGHLLTRLRDQGHRFGITEFVHLQLLQQLANVRGGLGYLFVPSWVPIPLMYRQLVSATVRVFMISVVLLAGDINLIESTTAVSTDIGEYRWIDLVYVLAVFLVYAGWMHVADELGNPFRISPDGLDFDDYVSSQRVDHATMVDDSRIKLPTVESIAEEPIPGEPDWNCPLIMRDHTYEVVPGWNDYKQRMERWRRQQVRSSTYDAFDRRRSSELAESTDDVVTQLKHKFQAFVPWTHTTNDEAPGGSLSRRKKDKEPTIKYLGF